MASICIVADTHRKHRELTIPGCDIHLGCPHLRDELKRIQPRLHVSGHIHASHGTHVEGRTKFVNAAVEGGPKLDVRHSPTLVTLDPRTES